MIAMRVRRRNTDRSHCSYHRQPLLEGQSERCMNDEKSDEECEQAERREVQVEAVGQPRQIPLVLRLNEAQLIARDRGEWRRINSLNSY